MTIYLENETMRILNSLCDVSINEFDDRLRLQKVAYLVQKLGASGGFTFSWYRRGPYSPSLAQALRLCNEVGELGHGNQLTRSENEVVGRLESLLHDNVNNPRTLELYGSLWYLMPTHKIKQNHIDYAIKKMQDEKPDYSIKELRSAITKILEFRNQKISK